MIRSREQYNSACEDLRILCQKDSVLGLNEAERIRFDALAEAVSRYEEDPAVFHARLYRQPPSEDQPTI
jgi:hypothetical protein